jgi:hypothetical protein
MRNSMTENLEALMFNSPVFYEEIARNGSPERFTPYVPTNWAAEDPEIMGGWKESNGTCPKCHLLMPASKVCDEC